MLRSVYKQKWLFIFLPLLLAIFIMYFLSKTPGKTKPSAYHITLKSRHYSIPSVAYTFIELQHSGPRDLSPYVQFSSRSDYSSIHATALNFGNRIANSLAVFFSPSYKQENSKIILKLAKSLELTEQLREHIERLGNGLIEEKKPERIISIFGAIQKEMEQELRHQEKEELAFLVQLGSWLETMRIISSFLAENYEEKLTHVLRKPHIADLYLGIFEQMILDEKIPKDLKFIQIFQRSLKSLEASMDSNKPTLSKEKVIQLQQELLKLKKLIEEG
ncbi:MAG: hypothetical protein H7A25_05695 [Leptospiraceae bacterium]|nr:hypothetical protein [Leptospiraceae bacterium]MCP5499374.1 hypothetical protein [Leptospiraceae bacterium]